MKSRLNIPNIVVDSDKNINLKCFGSGANIYDFRRDVGCVVSKKCFKMQLDEDFK